MPVAGEPTLLSVVAPEVGVDEAPALSEQPLAATMVIAMNAVISLGGCTASFVSPEGLTITNYHCAKGAIQYNSTEERNLLEQGFLAKTRDEEVGAGPGSRVLVTVAVSDVTDKVVGGLDSALGGAERYRVIEAREKKTGDRAIKRVQMPEDLAGAVAFFASPDSDFITGQIIYLGGP